MPLSTRYSLNASAASAFFNLAEQSYSSLLQSRQEYASLSVRSSGSTTPPHTALINRFLPLGDMLSSTISEYIGHWSLQQPHLHLAQASAVSSIAAVPEFIRYSSDKSVSPCPQSDCRCCILRLNHAKSTLVSTASPTQFLGGYGQDGQGKTRFSV